METAAAMNKKSGMDKRSEMKKFYLKYLAGLLLFGSNGVVASYIHLSSYEIVLLRSVLGAALLLGLFLVTGHRFTAFRHKKDLLFIALSPLFLKERIPPPKSLPWRPLCWGRSLSAGRQRQRG